MYLVIFSVFDEFYFSVVDDDERDLIDRFFERFHFDGFSYIITGVDDERD